MKKQEEELDKQWFGEIIVDLNAFVYKVEYGIFTLLIKRKTTFKLNYKLDENLEEESGQTKTIIYAIYIDQRMALGNNYEVDSLLNNNTWVVDLSPSLKQIECKWVFRPIYNLDGSSQTFKVRLVAKGFKQKE